MSALVFDRAQLRRRRRRVAADLAQHDFLLERVTEDLAERLAVVQRQFEVGANIGAHHGLLSRAVRRLRNVGYVVDVDSVPALLHQCEPGKAKVAADEEALPFAEQSLDLVVSGLSLQSVNDLPGTFAQVRRALKPDGLFLAALIGGRTLHELREAWLLAEAEMTGGSSPRVAPFTDVRDIGSLLQRAGFALPVVDADLVKVTYANPLALMAEIKAMGASNVLLERRKVPVTRSLLMRAAEVYAERFAVDGGRVSATFEIITLTAWAPHESQQKPLQPGSARMRLADALGALEQSAGEKSDPGK